jgi:hypothetical protein
MCFLRFELVAMVEIEFYLYGGVSVTTTAITCGLIRIQTGTFGVLCQIALGWINYQY